MIIGLLKTTLQHDMGWNEIDSGNLVFAVTAAYAVGMLVMGRFIDCLGTRVGYALAMVTWSFASVAHGFAGIVRRIFGRSHGSRIQRSRGFSCEPESDCGVVSSQGARVSRRHLHCPIQRWRDHHSADRAQDHSTLGMALGVFLPWLHRIRVACILDVDLSASN